MSDTLQRVTSFEFGNRASGVTLGEVENSGRVSSYVDFVSRFEFLPNWFRPYQASCQGLAGEDLRLYALIPKQLGNGFGRDGEYRPELPDDSGDLRLTRPVVAPEFSKQTDTLRQRSLLCQSCRFDLVGNRLGLGDFLIALGGISRPTGIVPELIRRAPIQLRGTQPPGLGSNESRDHLVEVFLLATGSDGTDQRCLRIGHVRQLRGLLLRLFRSELIPVFPKDQNAITAGQLVSVTREVIDLPYHLDLGRAHCPIPVIPFAPRVHQVSKLKRRQFRRGRNDRRHFGLDFMRPVILRVVAVVLPIATTGPPSLNPPGIPWKLLQ